MSSNRTTAKTGGVLRSIVAVTGDDTRHFVIVHGDRQWLRSFRDAITSDHSPRPA